MCHGCDVGGGGGRGGCGIGQIDLVGVDYLSLSTNPSPFKQIKLKAMHPQVFRPCDFLGAIIDALSLFKEALRHGLCILKSLA